jgi:SAM-dependent methyltransferase
MSLVLDEHRHYLADRPRVEAFRAALRALVKPGDVVLDLACGTGILGFLACEAGAARVYAVDEGSIIETARRFAEANGYADRITFIRELSTRAILPEAVDLVVCDQIGHLGIEAGAYEYLFDARRRFLKPGGRTVPGALAFVAAPIESDELRARVSFWTSMPAGLDVSAAREIALNTGYPWFVDPSQWLAEPAVFASSVLPPPDLSPVRGGARFTVARRGMLDGISAWFSAELAPGVRLTNAPGDPDRIDRRQAMLPIERALAVDEGDIVALEMTLLPPDLVSWRVSVTPRGAAAPALVSSHSTFRGLLLSSEDLDRTRPESYPKVNAFGEARRSVLELCDGQRSLRVVQDEVYARHRDLFPTRNDAAAFVAEVVTRYCTADAALPDREPAGR